MLADEYSLQHRHSAHPCASKTQEQFSADRGDVADAGPEPVRIPDPAIALAIVLYVY